MTESKTEYEKGYARGFYDAKVAIIHAIARQFIQHEELIPCWLDIGSVRPQKEVEND